VCAENDGVIVSLGDSFPSGDAEPPAHPNCVCDVAPVRDDGADATDTTDTTDAGTNGVEEVSPQGEDNVIHDGVVNETPANETFDDATNREWIEGQWVKADPTETMETLRSSIAQTYSIKPEKIESWMKVNKIFQAEIAKGMPDVYRNGTHEVVIMSKGGSSISASDRTAILKQVDRLQRTQPRPEMRIIVGTLKTGIGRGVLAYTHLDGKTIWMGTKAAKSSMTAHELYAGRNDAHFMDVAKDIPLRDYVMTHEWGHTQDVARSDKEGTRIRTGKIENAVKSLENAKEYMSKYSQTNYSELFAEMFAEWNASNGLTSNLLTQAFAKEFGWN
jgi:hypothetical protein